MKAIRIQSTNVLQIATGQQYEKKEEIRAHIGDWMVVDFGETGIVQGYFPPVDFVLQFDIIGPIYNGWFDVVKKVVADDPIPLQKEI